MAAVGASTDTMVVTPPIPDDILRRVEKAYQSVHSCIEKAGNISHVKDTRPGPFDTDQDPSNIDKILLERGPLELDKVHRVISFWMGHPKIFSISERKISLDVYNKGPKDSALSLLQDNVIWPNGDKLGPREAAMIHIVEANWHVGQSNYNHAIEACLEPLKTLTEREIGRPECVSVAWAANVLGHALSISTLAHSCQLPYEYAVATLKQSVAWYRLADSFTTNALPGDCDARLSFRVDAFSVACILGRCSAEFLQEEELQEEASQLLQDLPPEHRLREIVSASFARFQSEKRYVHRCQRDYICRY